MNVTQLLVKSSEAYYCGKGNGLFNDALNTFYLRLYGLGHIMVKDHSDSERGNPLPHGVLFLINSKGSFNFYMHHPTERITYTTAFVTPVVEHWLGKKN